MTNDKILEVLDKYEEEFIKLNKCTSLSTEMNHCLAMIPKIRGFLESGNIPKAMRWLGFMQGVFYAQGLYSIEQMADHNSPRENNFGSGIQTADIGSLP